MTKKEIKAFLENKNITEDQLDEMWSFCAAFPEFGGEIVRKLDDQGLTWRDLNMFAAGSIFGLYENIEKRVYNNLIIEEENEKGSN